MCLRLHFRNRSTSAVTEVKEHQSVIDAFTEEIKVNKLKLSLTAVYTAFTCGFLSHNRKTEPLPARSNPDLPAWTRELAADRKT